MKKPPARKASVRRPYESAGETKAAVGRIHAVFEKNKTSLAAEKKYLGSPEGVLKSTLRALLGARNAMVAAQGELDSAIVTLRRALPRK